MFFFLHSSGNSTAWVFEFLFDWLSQAPVPGAFKKLTIFLFSFQLHSLCDCPTLELWTLLPSRLSKLHLLKVDSHFHPLCLRLTAQWPVKDERFIWGLTLCQTSNYDTGSVTSTWKSTANTSKCRLAMKGPSGPEPTGLRAHGLVWSRKAQCLWVGLNWMTMTWTRWDITCCQNLPLSRFGSGFPGRASVQDVNWPAKRYFLSDSSFMARLYTAANVDLQD